MKIGIVGATGKQGNLLLLEAYKRGHHVTALIRNQGKLTHDVPYIEKELYDLTTKEVEVFDVIISAFNAPSHMPQLHQTALRHLTKILKYTNTRLYVVGGAGSLWTNPEQDEQFVDSADFPTTAYATANSMRLSLEELKASKSTTWTYVSPGARFDFEGEALENYTIGTDTFTNHSVETSYISYKDYAKGMLDIIESKDYANCHISLVTK